MSDATPGGVTTAPADGERDLGPWALEAIAALAQVDDEWRLDGEREFRWWPHRLAQAVRADPAQDAFGETVTRVHVSTDLLCAVAVSDRVLVELAEANLTSTLSGLALDPGGILSAHCHAWLHPGNAWQVNLLGTAAILQAATGEASVDSIREAIGGGSPIRLIPFTARARSGTRCSRSVASSPGRGLGRAALPSTTSGPRPEMATRSGCA